MPINSDATPKDYKVIIYNKTEIDDMSSAETLRVDTALDSKVDAQELGSPVGVATLGITGKISITQMDFSDLAQSGDETNNFTSMTPERTLYQIGQNTVAPGLVGSANGICPLDGNTLVDPVYLPPAQNVQTFVVDLLTDMYNLDPVDEGDRCIVTLEVDPADNGEYVAKVNILVAPSTSADWELLPNLSAVQSVNGETGNVLVTKANTPDIAANEADIITNGVGITANSNRITAERTFRDETGIDVDTIIGLGEHAVTDNLPLNADGIQYVEGIITIYGDERTVVNGGYVQLFWNGAIVASGELDGAYIARSSIDGGATWSNWAFEPIFTEAEYFDFTPQTPPLMHKEGRFFYDDSSKTHVSYTDIVGVSRNLGEQFDVRVHNITGTQLLNGRAVNGAGSSTLGNPNAKYANTLTFQKSKVAGILTNSIDNGNDGYATVMGSVDVDTTDATLFDWTVAEDDEVFLNDLGTYSNTRSAIYSYIGYVTVIGVNGKMLVKPSNIELTSAAAAFMDVADDQILSISTTPVIIQSYDSVENEGMIIDATTGIMETPYDGLYTFAFNMYGVSNQNNKILYVEIWDVTNSKTITRQVLATNLGLTNAGAKSFTYDARLLANTEYVVRLYGDDVYTFTVEDLQFSMSSNKIDTGA